MTYASEVLADVPDLYWKLNESSGTTAADSSGNGRSGTTTNVTFGSAGIVAGDTAGSFAAGHVSSSYAPTYTAVSVEAWFNLNGNTISGNPRLVSCGHTDTNHKGWDLLLTGASLLGPTWQLGNNTAHAIDEVSPMAKLGITSGWHHFVGTWDGSTIREYIDGRLVQYAAAAYASTIAEASIAAGWNPSYGGDSLTGLLAHVAVYPTALSAARILAHYRAAVPFTGSATAWRDTSNSDGAAILYEMTDAGSTITDYKAVLNGTYNGTVDHTQAPTTDGAAGVQFFNGGSGNNGQVNSFPAPGTAFTFEVVARFFALPGSTPKGILQLGSESNFMLRSSDSGKRAGQLNGNVAGAAWPDPGSANDLAVGRIYHLAVTGDGTTARLYMNGVQVTSMSATGSVTTATFQFPWDFTNGREANCLLAGIAYTASALSATKVAAHSAAALTGVGTAPVPGIPPIVSSRAALVRASTR